jgi:hypothetical protein
VVPHAGTYEISLIDAPVEPILEFLPLRPGD